MALYHEAAQVLESARESGESIKATVFGNKTWKTNPKSLVALASKTADWSEVLAQVIDNSELLKAEKSLSPPLSLVLTHDLLCSKKGVSLPPKHGLVTAITRHRSRLRAELTKAHLRRGFSSVEALRVEIERKAANGQTPHGKDNQFSRPRWARVNTICTTLEGQLSTTFRDFARVENLPGLWNHGNDNRKTVYIDDHIPNLLAVHPSFDITSSVAYRQGQIILQDKASCFPAYLLDPDGNGRVIDACAAPGNKTTHLAAILHERKALIESPGASNSLEVIPDIVACEKDGARAQILQRLVTKACAHTIVEIKANQDFTRLDPYSSRFRSVVHLLLDPSCSGSGIVGREDPSLNIHLPSKDTKNHSEAKTNKRKRSHASLREHEPNASFEELTEETKLQDVQKDEELNNRLEALAEFQLRILQHAMLFPSARKITYSTCSIYATENECVVIRALASDVARRRGWRVMDRTEQIDGLRKWSRRGHIAACQDATERYGVNSTDKITPAKTVAEACITCAKGTEEGTMGFFLCGFVRDNDKRDTGDMTLRDNTELENPAEEEWNGFSDYD